ncbi:GntR family transcriptional regulator [Amycolatopsis acidiphila]|uniref:GntR family transcriptional regulator n=1 Tax=Amycolatopsis acidiphila TaxID=715473 RepID=A0A558AB76_9PSEU|nr:GntR family transcriptional regulator [Amycolatopsis acidiphila]TVT21494.1 GntR family transcriptional regulator [Amycolatopsis acidiphila]UIJ63179.1 GntR family transcriptional regulator [Amycolatopsis acidiphila]GHG74210.1 GntR family transcriptional regulator [Amycolatopsis acidiphila]
MSETAAPKLSKSETVYQELRGRILSGRYVAGFRLVLDQLARELNVSTVPVREAVRRLEAEGLVDFTRNVGAEVAGIDTADYADAMQTLAYLEGAATSLAAPHLSAERLAEAAELNEQMRALQGNGFDPVRFTELNERFHRLLCDACPNRHLRELLGREWQRMSLIRRSSFTFVPGRSATSVTEHEQILRLLRTGTPADEVERVTRAHKLQTLSSYLTATRP